MKKLLLLLSIFLILVSCRSNDNEQTDNSNSKKGYFAKYKVNGNQESDEEFKNPLSENEWVIISGFDENLSSANGNSYDVNFGADMMFDFKKNPLANGSYVFDDSKNNSVLKLHVGNFYDVSTKDTYSYYGKSYNQNNTSTLTLTITNVTSESVKGTFYGKVYAIEDISHPQTTLKSFNITDGEFYLPIIKE